MEHPFPCKDPHVVIYTSVLVPGALLPTKESYSQLVIGTTLQGQWQQNEHIANLFIQAEREEVCFFGNTSKDEAKAIAI